MSDDVEFEHHEVKVKPLTEKQQVHKQIETVLKEYGREGDIPLGHAYWGLLNKYRGMK